MRSMDDSCCICGLLLAADDSDFPQWCKDIRALCRVGSKPTLSDIGYIDNDTMPFNLPIPLHGFKRFCYRRSPTETDDFCYPFHAACWTLLQDNDSEKLLNNNVETLFNIFESFHYDRNSRSLRWGHDYYFEDILDSCSGEEDIIAANKADLAILADPFHFSFQEEGVRKRRQKPFGLLSSCSSWLMMRRKGAIPIFVSSTGIIYSLKSWYYQRKISGLTIAIAVIGSMAYIYCRNPHVINDCPIHSGLLSLPPEILESVMCNLDFRDVDHLLKASARLYRRYSGDTRNLPSSFWESRFWAHGETSFARSIRPLSYSWTDWFFTVKSELRKGSNEMNLRNRKRIWKLGADLIALVCAIEEPDRVLHGDIVTLLLGQIRGPVASCLALKYDFEGCQELTQIYMPFGNRSLSQLRTITPSHVLISNRRLISGLTFTFNDGESVDAGYVMGRRRAHVDSMLSPKFLWLVSSPLGFEAITLDVYPQQFLDGSASRHGKKLAVARWALENLKGSIRIVRICIEIPEHESLDYILWTPPYPLSTPSMCKGDIAALYGLQRESFAPASTICIKPENGLLIAIKVYSPLGYCAGITSIQFIYDTGLESTWGSVDEDAASLTFFLDGAEQVVKVTVYKIDSLVCHLQFTTNLHRTSDFFPQLPVNSNISLECADYKALNSGYIIGFCGCFVESSKQLKCFGVIATTRAVFSTSPWLPPNDYTSISYAESRPREMPLGGIRNLGQQQSRLLLEKKYQSVQASINPVMSKYRRADQVTGLLFRSNHDRSHPDLLGQWTGLGETYNLGEDEQILGLEVTTIKPRYKLMARPLSQVEGITVVTNLMRITWRKGVCTQELAGLDQGKRGITEVLWDFNAIFDRVQCSYQ
ncbi:hypothetical protein G7Y89_g243 [Cudoniella acicularis]|uniref:F-box domain-containing protein n=1 Tax=Cudoniella acicularis TaxID=354080 RepID=A0A8H4S080_9HELO|nr:hypothetical protein G7Y89_g243 [Cudoniella acicularis]